MFSKPRRLLAQAKQLKSGRHVPKTAFSWLGIGPQLKLGSVRRHQRKERHHHAETLGFSRVGIFLFFCCGRCNDCSLLVAAVVALVIGAYCW